MEYFFFGKVAGSFRNQANDFKCKSFDWFLYKTGTQLNMDSMDVLAGFSFKITEAFIIKLKTIERVKCIYTTKVKLHIN